MLRKETIDKPTLGLLKKLMDEPSLKDFFLVGGTALALQIGHRISVDIDLFTVKDFDENNMLTKLEKQYSFSQTYQDKNTLKGEIEGIKVDLITHSYPLVTPLLVIEDIRMATVIDIAAMKLNAITGNGTRIKDFIDIAYLSSSLTFSEMVKAYEAKYAARNAVMTLKAVNFYDDIDFSEKVQVLDKKYKWERVKSRLDKITMEPKKLFPSLQTENKIRLGMSL
ncbi:MAG: nucleotidyl transferase AbiEii/AbiGii toxin family protein [Cyclobacteriaceae bacterium]|nr:nucleotidyl transferase AbiEii/AbiGii toxin family protein [Cyclobacteriaceae bacterium]